MAEIIKPARTNGSKVALRRFLPLGVLALMIILFFASGLHQRFSFDEIAIHYGLLTEYVTGQPMLSAFAVILIYAAATAVSFPAAWLLTVASGLIFGWALGTVLVVFGATIGACILYFAARYALAGFFKQKAGDILNKMAGGFRENATSYMLFLRLAAIFPFALVNIVPAILGVPFRTFAWTTFVGIIPGVIAYSFAGEGLRSIISDRAAACAANVAPCGEALTPGDLVTLEILIAFALLGVVSLIPVVLKRLRRGKSGDGA